MIEIDRPIPASLDAERAILGGVILDNDAFDQTERLSVNDFSSMQNQWIFRAMVELAEDGKPIDFVTLTEAVDAKHAGVEYITNLTDGLPRVKNIKHHIDIVLGLSRRRKFIHLAFSALEEAYDNSGRIDDLIARTEKSFLSIGVRGRSEPKHISDIIPKADAQVKIEIKRRLEKGLVGLPTGFKNLDEFTTGYRNREVTVIAGETSDGKSSLMKQGIFANIYRDTKMLVFSREVSDVSLTLDFKAHASSVLGKHIREGTMDLIESQKFSDCNSILSKWPVWIDDSRDLHIDDLVSKARRWIREQRKKPEDELMVLLDYAQLVKGNGRNQTEEMEDICAGLWGLSDAENIPMVVLSQLNYGNEKKKVRPQLKRLKNASRIEQDAHTLIFTYQPVDDQGQRMPEKSEIIVAKQRHGPTGILNASFDTDTLMFTERY